MPLPRAVTLWLWRCSGSYEISTTEPRWHVGWYNGWNQRMATSMCIREGNKVLEALGIEHIKDTRAGRRVLIELTLDPVKKQWTHEEWEYDDD